MALFRFQPVPSGEAREIQLSGVESVEEIEMGGVVFIRSQAPMTEEVAGRIKAQWRSLGRPSPLMVLGHGLELVRIERVEDE